VGGQQAIAWGRGGRHADGRASATVLAAVKFNLEIEFKPIQIFQTFTASKIALLSSKILNKNIILKISKR
jgi:hypothetical protein